MSESSDLMADIAELQGELSKIHDGKQVSEILKEQFKDYVLELQELDEDKTNCEIHLKSINKRMEEIKLSIRKEWGPFTQGSDKNSLDFGSCKLVMEPTLNVTMEDEEVAIDWLQKNGFENVLKFQVHSQTFKSIGRKLYQDPKNPVQIPGASYQEFQIVKLKK